MLLSVLPRVEELSRPFLAYHLILVLFSFFEELSPLYVGEQLELRVWRAVDDLSVLFQAPYKEKILPCSYRSLAACSYYKRLTRLFVLFLVLAA